MIKSRKGITMFVVAPNAKCLSSLFYVTREMLTDLKGCRDAHIEFYADSDWDENFYIIIEANGEYQVWDFGGPRTEAQRTCKPSLVLSLCNVIRSPIASLLPKHLGIR